MTSVPPGPPTARSGSGFSAWQDPHLPHDCRRCMSRPCCVSSQRLPLQHPCRTEIDLPDPSTWCCPASYCNPTAALIRPMRSKSTLCTSGTGTVKDRAPPQQLALLLVPPRSSASLQRPISQSPPPERLSPLDQRLSTAEVLRVVGVNRSTLFRWRKRGRFPDKHPCGGWLRSEVDKWLHDAKPAPIIPSSRDRGA